MLKDPSILIDFQTVSIGLFQWVKNEWTLSSKVFLLGGGIGNTFMDDACNLIAGSSILPFELSLYRLTYLPLNRCVIPTSINPDARSSSQATTT